MKIHFYIRFHTEFGQSLHISGNHPLLGNGDEAKSVSMVYFNQEFWMLTVDWNEELPFSLQYHYLLRNEDGSLIPEWGLDRILYLPANHSEDIRAIDTWNHAGDTSNVFFTDPFQKVLLPGTRHHTRQNTSHPATHIFKVKAPLLKKNEVVCLIGSAMELGNWKEEKAILLNRENGWWAAEVHLPHADFPLSYKYGIWNFKNNVFVRFEDGNNRVLNGDQHPALTYVHDGFIHMPDNTWRGAGVAIPVFSLRSRSSFGVGEFTDIRLLVDWAEKTSLRMIQLLPVNDTTATNSRSDSYPYAAISAFALHPLYINLEEVAGKKYRELLKPLKKTQKALNGSPEVDYEEVMKIKNAVLKELFVLQKEDLLNDPDYLEFFEGNRHWLVPYAAFCHLRDKNGTSAFNNWKTHASYSKAAIDKYVSPRSRHYEEIVFHYFIQYHLHLQLKDAADYAHKRGVILKGDIPIGVYRNGCDAWMDPGLYHMDMQAGAPPDDFAIHGQNWGFPTYHWEKMAEDGFQWWHKRFEQMGHYFDAFRIDHILGFFRIWSIPLSATQGIMGRFVPALPVKVQEFGRRGIFFDPHRFCLPYITSDVLRILFGEKQDLFLPYLEREKDGSYSLKKEWATQRQIVEYFEQNGSAIGDADLIRNGLLELCANVLLFEEEGSRSQAFHFRFHMHHTLSYQFLDDENKRNLYELYVDYFFKRQDDFWKKEALKKLPALKRSTNMLICGEDLGLVPSCVPDVMRQLGILSLELQRMPKGLGKEFFHPSDAPYLSVVTPSTHDMSTIRGWWEEDRSRTQRFFNLELGQWGEAPTHCESWINRSIVQQHLDSPAMWSVFQMQDILGMSETLRRADPHEERINIPADSQHYWNYRMHITLEELLKDKAFNHSFRDMVEAAGRG